MATFGSSEAREKASWSEEGPVKLNV